MSDISAGWKWDLKQFSLLSILTLLFNLQGRAGESHVHYSLHKETITVKSAEEGYSSTVYCRGKFTSLSGRETGIAFGELETIQDLQAAYMNDRGKYKLLPDEDMHQTSITGGSFFSGRKVYMLHWPARGQEELRFSYNYKSKCSELMMLSYFLANNTDQTDTFEYEIHIPKSVVFYYKLPEGVQGVIVDSLCNETGSVYHIVSRPAAAIVPPEYINKYESSCVSLQLIRVIVVPAAYRGRAWAWYNDWHRHLLKENPGLSTDSRKVFDALLQGVTDPDSITSRVFAYVKTRISYLDIENGTGAWKPRECNAVLLNRQGDCKDMANLLYEVLQDRGIKVYRALSSTIGQEYKLDFPCLVSSNHLICVAIIRGDWRYLDATESVCTYGYPSMQIQGRAIFIENEKGGELHIVPEVNAYRNRSFFQAKVHPLGNSLEGSFTCDYHGLSGKDAQEARFSKNSTDFNARSIKILEMNTQGTNFLSLKQTDADTMINLSGDLKAVNKINAFLGKNAIDLTFMPFPHKFPRKRDKGTKIITYQQEDNRFEFVLAFESKIKLHPIAPVRFSKDGFSFVYTVQQSDEHTLLITYEYMHSDVVIDGDQLNTYFEMNELIEQTFNKALVYE
jgi:hypothetical protein